MLDLSSLSKPIWTMTMQASGAYLCVASLVMYPLCTVADSACATVVAPKGSALGRVAGYARPKVLKHNLFLGDCGREARWRDALKELASMSHSYCRAYEGLCCRA